jgi:pimeloyl-ACP methyl ester carboxylesterase
VITSATYRVIYDAAELRFPAWPVAAVGVVVAALGVGLGAYFRRRGVSSALARTVVTSAIIFGVSWSLLVGGGLYAQHGQLRSALREGSFVRVEGLVYDSPPGAAKDAQGGSWVVESGKTAHWYRYDGSPLAVGYRRSAPGTGGLRDGSRVRIADIGGRIARVEVQE